MSIWRWVFKIALQVIPILIGLDWSRPKRGEPLLSKPKRKKRKYLNYYDY